MSLIKPETMRAHRASWYVWTDDGMIPRQSSMRGTWGFDVKCSCGWETRTGGATHRHVAGQLFDHRYERQATDDYCATCGGLLVDDGADGWICSACGDEFDAATVIVGRAPEIDGDALLASIASQNREADFS